jgi:hypothetical protein
MDLKKIPTEQLIDAVIRELNLIAENEEEYQNSEDSLDQEYRYAKEEAEGRSLEQLLEHVDDSIKDLVEKLQRYGVEEDEIKEILIESSDGKINNSVYIPQNTICIYGLHSYWQVDFDPDLGVTLGDEDNQHPHREDFPQLQQIMEEIRDRGEENKFIEAMNHDLQFSISEYNIEQILDGSYASGELYFGENKSLDLILDPPKICHGGQAFHQGHESLAQSRSEAVSRDHACVGGFRY